MMSVTHAAIAACISTISLGSGDPGVLGLAVIGSQFPDLDTTESFAGRALWPVAHWIEERYPHRTITHSFISTLAIAALASPLFLISWQHWAALVIGQFTGWFADCFTKAGCAAFFPNPARLVIPGNPKARLYSGSPNEYWILGITIILTVISINLASAGGISESFGLAVFQDSATAAKTFNKHGADHLVTAQVKGMVKGSGKAIADTLNIVEAGESDFIGESLTTGKLYKVGSSPDSNISPTIVKTSVGGTIRITSREQSLEEINLGQWLKRLPQNGYLSGYLILDDAQDARLSPPIEEYPTVRSLNGELQLSNARPSQLGNLRELWILRGRVNIKTR